MTTWYETDYKKQIKPVDIEKFTDSSVWFSGKFGRSEVSRSARMSEYAQYHPTWDEAKAYLLSKAESKVFHARRQLDQAKSEYGNILGMKNPEQP